MYIENIILLSLTRSHNITDTQRIVPIYIILVCITPQFCVRNVNVLYWLFLYTHVYNNILYIKHYYIMMIFALAPARSYSSEIPISFDICITIILKTRFRFIGIV